MNPIKKIDPSILQEIEKKLVAVYHPLAIYIFGSFAWGDPGDNSDLDIAVIVDRSDTSPYLRPQPGTLALWEIDKPIGLLVFTQQEFYSKSEYPGWIQNRIIREGVRIYPGQGDRRGLQNRSNQSRIYSE